MKAKHPQAMLLALGLMTRLPVHRWQHSNPSGATQGLAVAYYPLVGAVLGLLLWLAQSVLGDAAPGLVAFVLLLLWVLLTGALHLDGLADCADGYFAGHKHEDKSLRRERILAVMREPASGAIAVVALVMVLLGKWVALTVLLEGQGLTLLSWLLLLALPRAVLLPYMVTTPYARAQGIAAALKSHLPARLPEGVTLLCGLLALLIWPFGVAFWALLVLALLTWVWRALWQKLIGGFTGDCLGALIELAELSLIGVLAFVLLA